MCMSCYASSLPILTRQCFTEYLDFGHADSSTAKSLPGVGWVIHLGLRPEISEGPVHSAVLVVTQVAHFQLLLHNPRMYGVNGREPETVHGKFPRTGAFQVRIRAPSVARGNSHGLIRVLTAS